MQHENLVGNIERWTRGAADFVTAVPDLLLFRRETATQPDLCLVEPCLVVVVQGAKQMFLGGDTYRYDAGHFLVTSLDVSALTQVVEASPGKPCLGLILRVDLRIMAELIAQVDLSREQGHKPGGVMAIGTMTADISGALDRLVALLDEPAAIPVLAPLLLREIHYRVLVTDQASRLWDILATGSRSQRIARTIDWLKGNYSSPLRIEDLASRAGMSQSTFHLHFREMTAMSPLQYQKWLRLNEARRLMLRDRLDAAEAAFRVGYESASQFSREYGKLFGSPPKRDIEHARQKLRMTGQPEDANIVQAE